MNQEIHRAHQVIQRWFTSALVVVDPRRAVRRSLSLEGDTLRAGDQDLLLMPAGRLVVIAIGKAAPGMARGAAEILGSWIERGIILTKHGHAGEAVPGFQTYEAGHPVPDEEGLNATREILDAVAGLTEHDCVIALISGGGSALLELPKDGISLAQMQDVTRRLMLAGAGIHDLNTVRKALSQVKGGGLRTRIGRARCVSLLLSDVLGNDPSVIASGPTVVSSSTPADARAVLGRFGLLDSLDLAVRAVLERDEAGPVTIDTSDDIVSIIADNASLTREITRLAGQDGYRVELDDRPWDGEAVDLGREFVDAAREADNDVDVLVRGGEATVTVTGDGTGGRNTEMALAAAMHLTPDDHWVIASLASDGDDGNSGAAGGVADGGITQRMRAAGLTPDDALAENDSASALRAAGGLVVTGPTGTNVNDVYIALRVREERS